MRWKTMFINRYRIDRTLFNVALHLAISYFTGSPQIQMNSINDVCFVFLIKLVLINELLII